MKDVHARFDGEIQTGSREREARRAEKEFKTAPIGHNKEKLN
jgi:hypothetical protein